MCSDRMPFCFVPPPDGNFRSKNLPALRSSKWAVGLCNCCSAPGGAALCCYVACCSSCAYANLARRLPHGKVLGSGDYCASCVLTSLFSCVPRFGNVIDAILLQAPLRKFIAPPGRKESRECAPGCLDILTTACCGSCATCQQYNEVMLREKDGIPIFNTVLVPPSMVSM